jgi:hypothetical protein
VKRLPLFIFSALFFCVSIPAAAHAAQLSYVSDLITDSRPAYPANHTLSFEVMTAVPPAGSMIVRFEGGAFSMDPSFGSADASLATSTARFGGYVERPLGASPSPATDGFSAAYPEGPLTVTLSSGNGIPAGSFVELMLGTNASGGVYQITNPTSTGSYHVYIDTYDAAGTHLDYGAAMVAIVEGVGVTPDTDKITPAILSNGLPSSTIPSNVAGVLLSFNTDEYATCRYATTSGVSYDAMTNMFVNDLSATFHTAVVMGITNGVTYRYYVRCVDFAGNKNPVDYVISFTASNPTGSGAGSIPVGSSGSSGSSGGGGGGGGGGGAPYPAVSATASVSIQGTGFANSEVAVMEDGTRISQAAMTGYDGTFSVAITSLQQGAHSFTLFIDDTKGNQVTAYTTTMTAIAGAEISDTGIVLPPEIILAKDVVSPGDTVLLSGVSEPSSTVDLVVVSQASLQGPVKETVAADQNGNWTYALDTTSFAVDTYDVTAQSSIGSAVSSFSDIAYLGVGRAPVPEAANSDLNHDGKVNLVDFSIFLTHWGQAWAPGDFNHDGTVDLPDFSIMLYHWTG